MNKFAFREPWVGARRSLRCIVMRGKVFEYRSGVNAALREQGAMPVGWFMGHEQFRKEHRAFQKQQNHGIMTPMLKIEEARAALADMLRAKSVFRGDFTLSSGAKSNYYVDCKLTTLDPRGAWLAG